MSDKHSHHPHILPLRLYLGVGAALIFLTVVTVVVAQISLGPFNLVVALGIAAFKATLVALFFMHLKYDNRLFAVVFASSLAFLAIFITITMFDTLRRGDIYPEVGKPIKEQSFIYDDNIRIKPHNAGQESADQH
jgi:cytochrome c oxidase subunit 4